MRNLGIAALGLILAAAGTASAGESATATIAQTGTSPNAYTITLHNTGTEAIGTFWYSWIPTPFYDFMTSSPTVTGAPGGWIFPTFHEGAGDGYSVFWYTTNPTNDIPLGGTATFSFTSPDSLTSLTGPSTFYGGFYNTGTSYIYNGIESGDSAQILVTAPEPASVGLLGMVGAMLLKRNRRNK